MLDIRLFPGFPGGIDWRYEMVSEVLVAQEYSVGVSWREGAIMVIKERDDERRIESERKAAAIFNAAFETLGDE